MSRSRPKDVKNSQSNDALCLKYFGAVLRQEAINQLSLDDDPIAYSEEFAKSLKITGYPLSSCLSCVKNPFEYATSVGVTSTSITPNVYLNYLGTLGFNIEELKSEVASREMRHSVIDELRGSKEKAEEFFRIFQEEWSVDKADIEKYIDGFSIYHFIKLVVDNSASTKARLKAVKSHAEDYATKAAIFAWLNSQNWISKKTAEAADEIILQQPIKHSTAVSYYKEWKKLQSASRQASQSAA